MLRAFSLKLLADCIRFVGPVALQAIIGWLTDREAAPPWCGGLGLSRIVVSETEPST